MTEIKTMNHPLILNRADPWVYKHSDGFYYFIATEPGYNHIELRKASSIEDLTGALPVIIWHKHLHGDLSANIWAPEIHYIEGKWYIYFAAAKSSETMNGLFDHRIFVLENEAADPLTGSWTEKGQLRTNWESFALDATTFAHNGTRYLVWAQKDPAIAGNSNLYIAAMNSPWSIEGKQIQLAMPEYDWETIGFLVNEGPAVIKRNGRIFISYSASATDFNYCMGLLTANENDDLLDPASWAKSPTPVFQSDETVSRYGPGHDRFTQSPDGTVDFLIYHARNYKETAGDPLHDPNRHTHAQAFGWNADGTPNFN